MPLPFASRPGLKSLTCLAICIGWCANVMPRAACADELLLAEGESRLFLANADGSGMKRLADLEKYTVQGSPTWSRDGKLIAFDAHQAGQTSDQTQIVVVHADGSEPRALIDGAMPSFSPAGHRLTFSRYGANRGVWVMATSGPEKELVLLDEEGWSADWSPDGQRIAYSKRTGKGDNFVIFDLVEGTSTRLFKEGEEPYSSLFWNFMWSPDGRQIVFRGTKHDNQVEVGVIDTRGAEHGLITRLLEKTNRITSNFAWTPDGGRILLSIACPEREKRTQLYALNPRTLDLPELLSGQDPALMYGGLALSPDGQRLLTTVRKPKPAAKN